MAGFFSRLFNLDKIDAGTTHHLSLTGPSTESELDAKTIEAVLAEIDLDTAITSHENWKLRLQNILDGKSTEVLHPETICLDDHCDLGLWLHGPGGQKLGRYPAFQILIAQHKNFHAHASTVVALAQSKDIEKAQQIMDASYLHASTQVVLLLKHLKHGLRRY